MAGQRREFLRLLTSALGTAIGLLAAVPGLRFLAYPLRERTVWGGEEPIRVAALAELEPGQPLRVSVVGTRRDGWLRLDGIKLGACWLVRDVDGRVRAFSTVCPHLGCGIDWSPNSKRFDCPCHGSSFDADGRRVAGPSPRDMDELEVKLAGQDVKVLYRRFRVSTPKKEPLG
ncbi:MAG TPA: ubiquinol-cytochrome c reductase iron-sulfur subunit [Polyangia bacterium]|nr:ubiquinol-cytochrome c reductase iron-sulfur subunit [Polyangia bacterium]